MIQGPCAPSSLATSTNIHEFHHALDAKPELYVNWNIDHELYIHRISWQHYACEYNDMCLSWRGCVVKAVLAYFANIFSPRLDALATLIYKAIIQPGESSPELIWGILGKAKTVLWEQITFHYVTHDKGCPGT